MIHGMGMMNWHILGSLLGLLLIFLLVVAAVAVVRWMSGNKKALSTGRENAQSILKKRYAKGDISKEEFERIKNGIE